MCICGRNSNPRPALQDQSPVQTLQKAKRRNGQCILNFGKDSKSYDPVCQLTLVQYLYTFEDLRLYNQALSNISQTSSTYSQGSLYFPPIRLLRIEPKSMGFLIISK